MTDATAHPTFSDPRRVAMGASLLVAVVMLGGKSAAYALTGSAAILSDAAESVVHLFATGFAAFSLWYAETPPDEGHLYGHGKVAYFASGFEGGLILLTGVGILVSAGHALAVGASPHNLGTGLLIVAGLGALNGALGLALVRTGRRTNTLVLVSNGQHVLADMWTSLGVLVGVGLVWLTGLAWLDPLVAALVALHLLWTGVRLTRRSVEGLMEKADPGDTQALMDVLDEARRGGIVTNFHQLRHRRVGGTLWIEVHLLFPEHLRITEAHARSHRVEEHLHGAFPADRVHVTAHLEPAAHRASHPAGHAEPDDPLAPHATARGEAADRP